MEPKPKRSSPLPHIRKAHFCQSTLVGKVKIVSADKREEMSQIIMNRAMKGVRRGYPKGNAEEIAVFCDRFRPLSFWVVDMMRGGMSAAVGAVTIKAALFYGMEPAQRFCETMAKGTFNGADDPAHLLWKLLNKSKNRGKENATENYCRAVCAAKAFCEDRKVRAISQAKTDIFEWGPGLTVPETMQESVRAILERVRKVKG